MASTTGDTTTAHTLPDPPYGVGYWSIVTLASYLCVPPAAVDAHLSLPDSTGNSPDFVRPRLSVAYQDSTGDWEGDCYLHLDAAERIAAALPIGVLARAVVADEPQMAALLRWDQIHALAEHIVTHLGDPS